MDEVYESFRKREDIWTILEMREGEMLPFDDVNISIVDGQLVASSDEDSDDPYYFDGGSANSYEGYCLYDNLKFFFRNMVPLRDDNRREMIYRYWLEMYGKYGPIEEILKLKDGEEYEGFKRRGDLLLIPKEHILVGSAFCQFRSIEIYE